MADVTPNTVRARGLRGITPFLAAGSGVGDFSTLGTGASATMTIADAEITPNMHAFAQIQISADDDMYISSAKCGNKQLVITVRNRSGANLSAGDTTIAYFCIPNEKD
jgi:hypothetical protein